MRAHTLSLQYDRHARTFGYPDSAFMGSIAGRDRFSGFLCAGGRTSYRAAFTLADV